MTRFDSSGLQRISRAPDREWESAGPPPAQHAAKGTVTLSPPKHMNLLQVVHFSGRYYLRNGYHRLFDVISSGREKVPLIAALEWVLRKPRSANPRAEVTSGFRVRLSPVGERLPHAIQKFLPLSKHLVVFRHELVPF